VNNTEFVTITVNDVTVPVFNSLACAPDPANISDVVTCTVNITDDVAVGTVRANVTRPNGSVFVQSVGLVSGDVYEFNFTGTALIDLYNVSWLVNDTLVNDTSGNSATAVDNFTVQDVVNPVVVIASPADASVFNISDLVNITANVTDDVTVSVVLANVTFPNGTSVLSTMSLQSAPFYFLNFTGTSQPGNYTIQIIANDTSNNINNTEFVTITVNDVTVPVFNSLACAPDPANISDVVTCTVNITDDVAVDTVLANVTRPNGSVFVQSVGSVGDLFSFNFTGTALINLYNVSWLVNDTTGNEATAGDNFTVQDVVNPSVVIVSPTNGSVFNISDLVNITVNVTDDVVVDIVLTNVTFPNGTSVLFSTTPQAVPFFFTNFTDTSQVGTYTIQIIANDTSNNINNTEFVTITVNDVTAPVFNALACAPDPANISQTVTCNVTITDDVSVDTVRANVTRPNGGVFVQSVGLVSGDVYEFNFTGTA